LGFFIGVWKALDDTRLMRKAIELAKKGRGRVSPNPLVGAIIVKDGRIIGRGYHQAYGGPHAEINAISNTEEANCLGATLYVTLEPCNHEGKTPPCVDAVIKAGFRKVVVGTIDPNPLTNGRSVSKMLDAGIKVDVGVEEEESRRMNESFFKYITTGMPFVIMKTAQTLDSRIADTHRHASWITSDDSRAFVHEMRSHFDGVLIGTGTAMKDNPRLTVRHVEGQDPYRIILHGKSVLPRELHLFDKNSDERTIVAVPPDEAHHYKDYPHTTIWEIDRYEDGNINLSQLLIRAGKEKICSILLEGGNKLFTSFLRRKLIDKIYIAIAPKILGAGVPAFNNLEIETLDHAIELIGLEYSQKGNDIWVRGYPFWR